MSHKTLNEHIKNCSCQVELNFSVAQEVGYVSKTIVSRITEE